MNKPAGGIYCTHPRYKSGGGGGTSQYSESTGREWSGSRVEEVQAVNKLQGRHNKGLDGRGMS